MVWQEWAVQWTQGQRRQSVLQIRHPAHALALMFLCLIILGGLLLRLPFSARGEAVSWSTAFFTATSAVCVTGLAVVDTAKTYSFFGQAVILFLIQVGGLGYMLSATLLFMLFGRQPALNDRLLLRDTLGQVTLRDTARLVWRAVLFTFAVELIGAVFLTLRFMTEPDLNFTQALWRGIFHSVSAFCNAGFDLSGDDAHGLSSLLPYRDDWLVNFVIAALIIIGGLGFTVCLELGHRLRFKWPRRNAGRERLKPLSLHTRLVVGMSVFLTFSAMLIILLTEWSNSATLAPLPFQHKLLTAFFQSVTLRTAGFATVDFNNLRSITLLVMGLFMFIGASPGGTGGGVKTTTMAAMLATVKATLRNQPDAEIFNRSVPLDVVYRAVVLIIVSFGIIVTGIFILTFTEPVALQEAGLKNIFVRLQFEVISAFGTVGLSTGITGHLTEAGRVVIMLIMFIGRLGPTAAATVLAAPRQPLKRRLPQETVALG